MTAVDASAGERVQTTARWLRGFLAGPGHLGDATAVQGHASNQLYSAVLEPLSSSAEQLVHEREDSDEKFLQGLRPWLSRFAQVSSLMRRSSPRSGLQSSPESC